MMGAFKPRIEILPLAQQRLWPALRSAAGLVYFKGGDLGTLTRDEKSCLIDAASAVRDLPRVEVLARQLTAAKRTP